MNLSSCGLALTAWLVTGDNEYRSWMTEYTEAWIERAEAGGSLVPDNVGPSGKVGELHGGAWFGGLYGWSWPHGAFSVLQAVAVASTSCFTATGDDRYLDFVRSQVDRIMDLGRVDRLSEATGALRDEHLSRFEPEELGESALLVPHRHGPEGWHDYLPMELAIPTAIWLASGKAEDWDRIERIRSASTYDWCAARPTRQKEDSGHEEPWLAFIAGDNQAFPVASIAVASDLLARRLEAVARDETSSSDPDIHHWQKLNPVSAEVLLQNRLGGTSPLYYGGLFAGSVRLQVRGENPERLATLVDTIDERRIGLTLANTDLAAEALVTLEAGALGQHGIERVVIDGVACDPRALRSIALAPDSACRVELEIVRNALAPTLPGQNVDTSVT